MRWGEYPKYSESAVPWVGAAPKHWESTRVKFVTSINDDVLAETTDPGRPLQYVDIGNVDGTAGITGTEAITFEYAPSRARRLVRDGDVIVSTVRTYLRAVAGIEKPDPDLVISTGFAVLRPKPALSPKFAAYAFKAPYFVNNVVAHSVGVSYPAINPSELVSLKVVVPPLEEQQAIAAFLDRETARIEALIANKHRQIELLQEKRQAVITQAVTRGLDPDAPMKESGVEWIGEIPTHWEIARLGFLARVTNGSTPDRGDPRYWTDGTIPWLPSGHVNDLVITEPGEYISETALRECPLQLLPANTVLVGMVGEGKTRGMSAIMGFPACINQNTAGIVVGPRLRAWFLLYVLLAGYHSLREFGRGGQQDALNCQIIRTVSIPVPSLNDQDQVINRVVKETQSIERLVQAIQQSINYLREYRTALISAAVTGKIDMRDPVAERRPTAPLPFRRAVLGAEIIERLQDDPHFGRTKFEKALYLCEHHLGMELEGTYQRAAAGPLDMPTLKSIEKLLGQQHWYKTDESSGRVRYVPLEKAGAHDRYFERYWGQHREALDTFLALFRQLHTERCEIVATLYAAWNDPVLAGGTFTDADIVREVRERWHERKERFAEERLQRALGWMRQHGLVPAGRGRPTRANGTDAATGEPS